MKPHQLSRFFFLLTLSLAHNSNPQFVVVCLFARNEERGGLGIIIKLPLIHVFIDFIYLLLSNEQPKMKT